MVYVSCYGSIYRLSKRAALRLADLIEKGAEFDLDDLGARMVCISTVNVSTIDDGTVAELRHDAARKEVTAAR